MNTTPPLRVLYHHSAGEWTRAQFKALEASGVEIVVVPDSDNDQFGIELERADVIWHVLKPIGRADFECAPRLRLVQKIGVGVNTIDLAAARDFGILVCNMPGSNSTAVAEMTLTLMFAALRRLMPIASGDGRANWWRLPPALQEQPMELRGKTVGFVGFGQIPQLIAPVLTALGTSYCYTATAPHHDASEAWRTLPDLLEQADIVSIHVPLTERTRRLIDADAIGRMRPGAVLVNTSRGEVVDEEALVDALQEGRLAAAGLDVFDREPLPETSPLLALPNVVATPHVAWQTRGTMERSLAIALENCQRLNAGVPLLYQVV